MKKTLTLLGMCLLLAVTPSLAQVRYGTLHRDSILSAMPEYKAALVALDTLRARYDAELRYNEQVFNRQFAEYLQGQKDFPQVILLKRQRDLQEAMEKQIAWRAEADGILAAAREDLLRPAKERLQEAIAEVGLDRGYEAIVNLDEATFPFVHPSVAEDATPYVLELLKIEP